MIRHYLHRNNLFTVTNRGCLHIQRRQKQLPHYVDKRIRIVLLVFVVLNCVNTIFQIQNRKSLKN